MGKERRGIKLSDSRANILKENSLQNIRSKRPVMIPLQKIFRRIRFKIRVLRIRSTTSTLIPIKIKRFLKRVFPKMVKNLRLLKIKIRSLHLHPMTKSMTGPLQKTKKIFSRIRFKIRMMLIWRRLRMKYLTLPPILIRIFSKSFRNMSSSKWKKIILMAMTSPMMKIIVGQWRLDVISSLRESVTCRKVSKFKRIYLKVRGQRRGYSRKWKNNWRGLVKPSGDRINHHPTRSPLNNPKSLLMKRFQIMTRRKQRRLKFLKRIQRQKRTPKSFLKSRLKRM